MAYEIFLHTQYHDVSFTGKQEKRKEGQVKFYDVFLKTGKGLKDLGILAHSPIR